MNGGAELVTQRVHWIALGYEDPDEIVGAYEDAWVRTWLRDDSA